MQRGTARIRRGFRELVASRLHELDHRLVSGIRWTRHSCRRHGPHAHLANQLFPDDAALIEMIEVEFLEVQSRKRRRAAMARDAVLLNDRLMIGSGCWG